MIDKMAVREGDQVWMTNCGCNHGVPYVHIYGGVVLAAGGDGGFVFRTAEGRVDSCPSWSLAAITATEAEAWQVAASRLASIAGQIAEKAAECRVNAAVEVAA